MKAEEGVLLENVSLETHTSLRARRLRSLKGVLECLTGHTHFVSRAELARKLRACRVLSLDEPRFDHASGYLLGGSFEHQVVELGHVLPRADTGRKM